jgi:hypothetical protein
MMQSLFAALQYVTGPITLVAFCFVCYVVYRKYKQDHERKLITQASDKAKDEMVEAALDRFRRDYGNLTREQKFDLYKREISAQNFRLLVQAIVGVLLVAIGCVTFAIAGSGGPSWDEDLELVTRPEAYGQQAKVSRGATFTLSVLGVPADAKLSWSEPRRGSLDPHEGNNVVYTAEKNGRERLSVKVQKGFRQVEKTLDFDVIDPLIIE